MRCPRQIKTPVNLALLKLRYNTYLHFLYDPRVNIAKTLVINPCTKYQPEFGSKQKEITNFLILKANTSFHHPIGEDLDKILSYLTPTPVPTHVFIKNI